MLVPYTLYEPVLLTTTEEQVVDLESLLGTAAILFPRLRLLNCSSAQLRVVLEQTEDLGLSSDPLLSGANTQVLFDEELTPGTIKWYEFDPAFLATVNIAAVTSKPPVLYHTLRLTNLAVPDSEGLVPKIITRVSLYALMEQITKPVPPVTI